MTVLVRYAWADLVRNPRRTLSTMVGVVLGVGLSCAVLFFVDGLSASMTQRAVAPLPVDMQVVLTEPVAGDLILRQTVTPPGPLAAGEVAHVELELTNTGRVRANEVTLRSVPSAALRAVPGTAGQDGEALGGDEPNPFASGVVGVGRNLGTLRAGATVTAGYDVRADAAVDPAEAEVASTVSSREVLTPISADRAGPADLSDLASEVAALDGIAFAEPLSFFDLPGGSLSGAGQVHTGPSRVFAFSADYAAADPTVQVVSGDFAPGRAMIAAEVASDLGLGIGDPLSVTLPDGGTLLVDVGGVVDLRTARTLFASRQGADFETFVYRPGSIVLDRATFAREIVPAFERAAARRDATVRNPPVNEIEVGVERDLLDADPGTALSQTQAVAATVLGRAGDQDYILDNISNTLGVARDDASTAKRLFVFLGLPGGILAAVLAAYAGNVLAAAQRREQATLRIRGAGRGHLLTALAVRVAVITAVGAVIGVALGYLTAVAVVGQDTLARATTTSLLASGAIGTVMGLLATGTALYVTGRRSIDREINEDRARMVTRAPVWRRLRLDVIGVAAVASATAAAIATSAFRGTPGSVYVGQAVRLPLWLLVLPIGAWIAGCLLTARLFAWLLARRAARSTVDFHRPIRVLGRLSLRRRSWAVAEAAAVVGLIVALGSSLAVFTASYDRAKEADARFVLGGDLRIARAAGEGTADPPAVEDFLVDGVEAVTPVVYGVHDAIIRSDRTSEVVNLAAVDPDAYGAVAPLQDAHFADGSADAALRHFRDDPRAILLSEDMAAFLEASVGDPLEVLLDRGGPGQVETQMHLAGLFSRIPGFPDGADALIDIGRHTEVVPTTTPTWYLARTTGSGLSDLDRAVTALRAGPGAGGALQIDTRTTVLAKDQSSLAALNIRGLLDLDSGYALAMGTVTVAIFVFGLLLQRRREYVTLRAQGVRPSAIRGLIMLEAGVVGVLGCVGGVVVGWVMGWFLVNVLRPLFVLPPPFRVPVGTTLTLVVVVLGATVVTSLAASSLVNRLRATELLRDE